MTDLFHARKDIEVSVIEIRGKLLSLDLHDLAGNTTYREQGGNSMAEEDADDPVRNAVCERADQLRGVLEAIDQGVLGTSAWQRAFTDGALHAMELMRSGSSVGTPFSGGESSDGRVQTSVGDWLPGLLSAGAGKPLLRSSRENHKDATRLRTLTATVRGESGPLQHDPRHGLAVGRCSNGEPSGYGDWGVDADVAVMGYGVAGHASSGTTDGSPDQGHT